MSRLLLTLALLLAGSNASRAQAAPSPASEECFGFSFGTWDPPLKSIGPSASSAPASSVVLPGLGGTSAERTLGEQQRE
jgi:hypothetical protein